MASNRVLPGLYETPERVELETVRFDGHVYEHARDHTRLVGQMLRIRDLMSDGQWRTVHEIHLETGDPETSVSAQLRNLRKVKFGGYTVDKRRRGGETSALWEFRVVDGCPG